MEQDQRGILYPDRLPEFHRLPAPTELEHAVRWFWIARWNLPPGLESRQELLPFPACNIVVEPQGVTAVGPPTRISERKLSGTGWVVGALLLPAAVPSLVPGPAELRDGSRPVSAGSLHSNISQLMATPEQHPREVRLRAVAAFSKWISERVPLPLPGSDHLLANELARVLADPGITRADQIPDRLPASTRSLQRLANRFFGLSLHTMIRRRRLQEAAALLRDDPSCSLADLASELGYSDHAHFSTDFKAVTGMTPSSYRTHSSEYRK
ncbi:AraC family transcriptional regulator [Leucobacter viscericola]|uniref:AraC family transcriptional regulator n=1 Tax=Leucobacter viscericola TaxID=2714935 RepID=A0A6G7XGM7_9MICO|nr:AraC family transcriptional regulator [Leucobacter viscericola]QIK63715.1 AraC family transcriptional regulator [Leucobacter viscericola]